MVMKIKKVLGIPQPNGQGKYEADTIYFVRVNNRLELHMTSSDGETITHIPTQGDILSTVVAYQATPPALPNEVPFWMDTYTFVLYMQYNDGRTVQWIEAMPSYVPPEFAGSGSANTMARSDHNHDDAYVKIDVNEW